MKKILCAATVLLSFHAYAGEAKKSLSADTVNINLKYLSGMQKEDAEIADGLLNEFAEKYPAIKIIRKMLLIRFRKMLKKIPPSPMRILFFPTRLQPWSTH